MRGGLRENRFQQKKREREITEDEKTALAGNTAGIFLMNMP
jgi:hypothetical protein